MAQELTGGKTTALSQREEPTNQQRVCFYVHLCHFHKNHFFDKFEQYCPLQNVTTNHGCTNCGSLAARKWRENEKMRRKLRENEEMERDLLSTFPHFLFISPLSIHFQIKNCLILSQNIKYVTFIANLNI